MPPVAQPAQPGALQPRPAETSKPAHSVAEEHGEAPDFAPGETAHAPLPTVHSEGPAAPAEGHGEGSVAPTEGHGEGPAAPAEGHGEGSVAQAEGSTAPAEGHGEGPAGHAEPKGGHHGHHEAPGEINWAQGFLGERDHGPYGLLFRPKGTPPPLFALLLNTGIVLSVLYLFGRTPIQQALQQRRAAFVREMEDAAKMKAEAEVRLRVYQQRLERLDEELERLKQQSREHAEAERERVLAEARSRRERMEQEARRMVQLELKAAREQLQALAIRKAVGEARQLLLREVGSPDQRRLLQRHTTDLQQADLGSAP